MERADEVDVGGEDRNRVALLRRLQRLLARLGHGVVEADDMVFLDLQGFGAHGALVSDWRADARRPVACQWEGDSAKMSAVMYTAHYPGSPARSEEHTSELQSLIRTSYAVFCFQNKIITLNN